MKYLSYLFMLLLALGASNNLKAQNSRMVRAQKWVKGKPNQPWENFSTTTIDDLKGFSPLPVTINEYGSIEEDSSYQASGYFRTQKINNRWWMIDPEGKRHFHRAINSFRPGNSDHQKECFDQKFGEKQKWIEASVSLFKELGFYSTGSWSEDQEIREYNRQKPSKLSYSTNVNFMSSYGKKRGGTYQLPGNTGYPNQCIFVFDPEFETFCEQHFQQYILHREDPNLIGYFSDNELPFGLKNLEGYLKLQNPNDPGRIAAEKWLQEKGIKYTEITDIERAEFAGLVADRYYQTVAGVIRKYDPNHLYLGSRLHGGAKFIKQIVEAAGRHCDIISFNYYGVWTPPKKTLSDWQNWGRKPFWITEFYTKAMDSGLSNTTGAGFTVETQQDRGHAYQNFCMALAQSPNCVGWDWFRYQDNDPTAKGADPSNLDSNKGLVDRSFNPYEPLSKSMQQLNKNIYELIRFFDEKQ